MSLVANTYIVDQHTTHFDPGDAILIDAVAAAAGVDAARLVTLGTIHQADTSELSGKTVQAVPLSVGLAPRTFTHDGEPTNGTSGTYAGLADQGSPLVDVSASPPVQYINTGTRLSPTWVATATAPYPGVLADGSNGLTVTGAVAAASLGATGAITGASVAVTGASTAASYAATGAVTGATVTATGRVTAGTVVITPAGSTGAPSTGAHLKGEMAVDSAGALYICITAGSPGTWKLVTVS